MTDADLDNRTLAMIIDYIVYVGEQQNPDKTKKKPKARKATQADFDNF